MRGIKYRMKRKIFFLTLIIGIFLLGGYMVIKFYTPLYDGRLTIDIRNNTFKEIKGIKISYSDSPTIIEVNPIKPLERIIVLPPKESENTLMTSVYINYNGKKKEIINSYRTESMDGVIVELTRDEIKVKYDDSYFGGVSEYISFRPYQKVYDLEGADWDGNPPLMKFFKETIKYMIWRDRQYQ